MIRNFSSEPEIEEDSDHVRVTGIFSRLSDKNEIGKEIESNSIVITHELGLKVLKGLESNPDVARRFFDWVLESDDERLSSKSYNLMLGILGVNGFVEEFWSLVDAMKKKGYGVSGHVRDKVSEKFEKDGLKSDLERLRGVFASGSIGSSVEKVCSRLCKIVKNEEWSEDVERKLGDLNITFSSDLVRMVLENLAMEPEKSFQLFRWIEESSFFKHNEQTYNVMARILGREDCLDSFWKIVHEIRNGGYEIELETYVKVTGRFCYRKMIKEAVELYEFAMASSDRPSMHSCTFLLRKIVVSKQLDMSLFSRVVKAFTGNGNLLTESMLKAVLKSLRSVGRVGESNQILKAMEEGGFAAGSNVQSKVAFGLSYAGKKDEAQEFEQYMEATENDIDDKVWASFVEGHCLAGDLEKASDSFQKMVGKGGASYAAHAFEKLVIAYCNRNRAIDAYKLLHDYVTNNQLKPWHSTYKILIRKLLSKKLSKKGGFNNALNLFHLMKDHGFPPFIDPFIDYLSRSGNSDEAVMFLKGMTSKKFPSTSVVLRVIEAFLKKSRHNEAHDLLSKCPGYIRNHADVLDLFYSMKCGEATPATAVSV